MIQYHGVSDDNDDGADRYRVGYITQPNTITMVATMSSGSRVSREPSLIETGPGQMQVDYDNTQDLQMHTITQEQYDRLIEQQLIVCSETIEI